eukprot:TRINITY_DN4724_c0_g2_i1.p1 TRINITY_DN4724_c0_g2~~TRINITY_DN4724_c0_g2_i1.p1  ORF type:complete len:135 (+),score=1.10 TRINITY_DN4724_c0_g2_i1:110-514(+)
MVQIVTNFTQNNRFTHVYLIQVPMSVAFGGSGTRGVTILHSKFKLQNFRFVVRFMIAHLNVSNVNLKPLFTMAKIFYSFVLPLVIDLPCFVIEKIFKIQKRRSPGDCVISPSLNFVEEAGKKLSFSHKPHYQIA